jgi:hypothetical protein
MPKIRKGGCADFGNAAGGSGAPCLGWRRTAPRVAVPPPYGVRCTPEKGGATPRKGCVLGTSLVAFSDPRTTQTCSFLLLFFSNFTKLIQINSNNFSFANVPTPPSVHHHVYVH